MFCRKTIPLVSLEIIWKAIEPSKIKFGDISNKKSQFEEAELTHGLKKSTLVHFGSGT